MDYVHKTAAELDYYQSEDISLLLKNLEALELEGYKEKYMPSYNNWNRNYSGNNLVLAIDSSKTVGMVDYYINDNICTINELIVSSKYRRHGIATGMYTKLTDHLKKDTWVDEIHLSVRANNNAIEFYKSIGFSPYHIEMCSKI